MGCVTALQCSICGEAGSFNKMADIAVSLLAAIFGVCRCRDFFDCTLPVDSYGGVFLWLVLMGYMFKTLCTLCDGYFVPSLEAIIDRLNIPDDLASATLIALGSSAPKFFMNVTATFMIVNASGIGAVVGSGIFNILVTIGVTGLIACKNRRPRVWWYPLLRDGTFLAVSILELVLILQDEAVEWYEGLVMIATYLLYCLVMTLSPHLAERLGIHAPVVTLTSDFGGNVVFGGRNNNADTRQELAELTGPTAGPVEITMLEAEPTGEEAGDEEAPAGEEAAAGVELAVGAEDEMAAEAVEEVVESPEAAAAAAAAAADVARFKEAEMAAAEEEAEEEAKRPPGLLDLVRDPLELLLETAMPNAERLCWLLFGLSLLCVAVCAYTAVDSAVRAGEILTVPPAVMGLTFLAVGSSVPDFLDSIAIAKQGEGIMAVANGLGTGVFDILVGLGVPWFLRSAITGRLVFKGEFFAMKWDIFVLAFALALLITMVVYNRNRITKVVCVVLMGLYAVYCLYLFIGLFTLRSPARDP